MQKIGVINMENLDFIRTHIEASAPCSFFSVAAWSENQLNISKSGFIAAIDILVSSNVISITSDDNGLVIDLI